MISAVNCFLMKPPSYHLSAHHVFTHLPSTARSNRVRTDILSQLYSQPLDRVQVLGNNDGHGHTGCVNALSWACNGELLISGGDDRTVRLWQCDENLSMRSEPPGPLLSCCGVINTGHRANIFNARMLPHSSRIATVAGDRQVCVFDVGEARGNCEVQYASNTRTHHLLCHEDRVKRIVTEDSPDIFLTVSEDGTVRQHDLRRDHRCRSSCPAPLVQMDHELTSLAMSPLTPYQFVVGGQSSYGYLFDRRFLKTKEAHHSSQALTTCTRLFGRPNTSVHEQTPFVKDAHISGIRMNATTSDEIIMAYNRDCVYRYSTRGETSVDPGTSAPSILQSNDASEDTAISKPAFGNQPSEVPVILPSQRYVGARNVETIKDVNFLGPRNEYVTVGSDEGNFFVWNKASGALHGIYEGDSSVVNVIEGHPHLPLVAVSGIDTTVKLFAPKFDPNTPNNYSRLADADSIIKTNLQPGRRAPMFHRFDMLHLLAQPHHSGESDDEVPPCRTQ